MSEQSDQSCPHFPRLRELEKLTAKLMQQRDAALAALKDAGMPLPAEAFTENQ